MFVDTDGGFGGGDSNCRCRVNRQVESHDRVAASRIRQRVCRSIGAFSVSNAINPSETSASSLHVNAGRWWVDGECYRIRLVAATVFGGD